jgi:hypothetical protein
MSTPGPNSRYARAVARTWTAPDGEAIPYIGRRVIPDTDRYQELDRYRVRGSSLSADGAMTQVERIDQVGDGFYGDPLQYWRICDANCIERPAEACADDGKLLIIPLPLELSGNGDA